MKKADIKGTYHRLTLATSEDYSSKERLLCLKECFEELSINENFLTTKEVSEIIEFVQEKMTKHLDEIL
uniref:hypothetical protein n=1 Tax=uncultured Draconibacterium sp. TaxID=1573823 RepID=UPI00321725AC